MVLRYGYFKYLIVIFWINKLGDNYLVIYFVIVKNDCGENY